MTFLLSTRPVSLKAKAGRSDEDSVGQIHSFSPRRGAFRQDAFLQNAASIYAAAEAAVANGQDVTEMTILVRSDGVIRMVAETDWPLESLRVHHGADMAYRVSRNERTVTVDCRTGSRNCRIETGETEGAAKRLLSNAALYRLEAGV